MTWRPKHDGDATLDIADLIRPFRYDVVVRGQLFDTIDHQRPLVGEGAEFADAHGDHPYAVWFREVELARFFPWVLGDQERVRAAYAERVTRAIRTFDSVERHGFDTGRPVTLRRVRLPGVSESGVPVSNMLHVGDGGHRLALLMRAGLSLAPSMYRVDTRASAVIDNTAVLARGLGLREDEWVGFVAPHFVRTDVTTLDDLRRDVELQCPTRVGELAALVTAHDLMGTRL